MGKIRTIKLWKSWMNKPATDNELILRTTVSSPSRMLSLLAFNAGIESQQYLITILKSVDEIFDPDNHLETAVILKIRKVIWESEE